MTFHMLIKVSWRQQLSSRDVARGKKCLVIVPQ